jgi:hypothetical protein
MGVVSLRAPFRCDILKEWDPLVLSQDLATEMMPAFVRRRVGYDPNLVYWLGFQ